MSREPRKLIDLLVGLVVLALGVLLFVRPAAAYPPGTDLSLNTKQIIQTPNGKRVELIVRHAVPGTLVKLQFEDRSKSKRANSRGIAVFSFKSPRLGAHISAATNGASRASTTVYIAHASILRLRSAQGSTNYVSVSGAKPGAVVTLKVAGKTITGTVDGAKPVVLSFTVPNAKTYPIKVYVGQLLLKSATGTSY